MIEMLLVGAIVLVATLYSTWALMPAPARQRLARRLLEPVQGGLVPRLDRSPDPGRSLGSGYFRRCLRRVQFAPTPGRTLALTAGCGPLAAGQGIAPDRACPEPTSVITCSPAMAGCCPIRAVVRGRWGGSARVACGNEPGVRSWPLPAARSHSSCLPS